MGRWEVMVSAKVVEAKAGVVIIEEATTEVVSKAPLSKAGATYRQSSASGATRRAI